MEKVTKAVKVFFDLDENYKDFEYVRAKIEAAIRREDQKAADYYRQMVADADQCYDQLGRVVEIAIAMDVQVRFQAGSTNWVVWGGMDGLDPDDFYDDYEDISAYVEDNWKMEQAFMVTWRYEYIRLKELWFLCHKQPEITSVPEPVVAEQKEAIPLEYLAFENVVFEGEKWVIAQTYRPDQYKNLEIFAQRIHPGIVKEEVMYLLVQPNVKSIGVSKSQIGCRV
jgi:hypothetical protein